MKSIRQRLHAFGVHSVTIQPEVVRASFVVAEAVGDDENMGIGTFSVDIHNNR
jgi:zinc transporter 1